MKKTITLAGLIGITLLTGCSSTITSREYRELDPNMYVSNYDRIEVPSEIGLDFIKADTVGLSLVNIDELRDEVVSSLNSKGIKVVKDASEKYVFSVERLTPNGTAPRENLSHHITGTTGDVGLGFVGGALLKTILGDSGVWNARLSIKDVKGNVLREVKHTKLFIGMDHEDASEKLIEYFSPKIAEEFFVLKSK